MTAEYRNTQLENARKEYAKARAAFDRETKWNKAKLAASESLEFWGNKLAFFECMKNEVLA